MRAEAEEEMAVAGVAGIVGSRCVQLGCPIAGLGRGHRSASSSGLGSRWRRLVAIAIDNAHDRPPVDLVKAGELHKDAKTGLLCGDDGPAVAIDASERLNNEQGWSVVDAEGATQLLPQKVAFCVDVRSGWWDGGNTSESLRVGRLKTNAARVVKLDAGNGAAIVSDSGKQRGKVGGCHVRRKTVKWCICPNRIRNERRLGG